MAPVTRLPLEDGYSRTRGAAAFLPLLLALWLPWIALTVPSCEAPRHGVSGASLAGGTEVVLAWTEQDTNMLSTWSSPHSATVDIPPQWPARLVPIAILVGGALFWAGGWRGRVIRAGAALAGAGASLWSFASFTYHVVPPQGPGPPESVSFGADWGLYITTAGFILVGLLNLTLPASEPGAGFRSTILYLAALHLVASILGFTLAGAVTSG